MALKDETLARLESKLEATRQELSGTGERLAGAEGERDALAQQNQITFLSPGQRGERLRATASERALAGRSGVYDVEVTGADGRQVALFQGLSRQIKGQHFDE